MWGVLKLNFSARHQKQIMRSSLVLALIILFAASLTSQTIPFGKSVTVDGKIESNEWDKARKVSIKIEKGWKVKIAFKQDENNLYFRFSNLKIEENKELYPEVLIDATNSKTKTWEKNQWWFHASYSNCEGDGVFNNYKSCKKGEKTGWNANNFPLEISGEVEISVSKSHLNLRTGDILGLAFDVTDTDKKWFFYPARAKLESPETWANFKL